jgi:hypothetical protein
MDLAPAHCDEPLNPPKQTYLVRRDLVRQFQKMPGPTDPRQRLHGRPQPDRADALVWGLTELFPRVVSTGSSSFTDYRQQRGGRDRPDSYFDDRSASERDRGPGQAPWPRRAIDVLMVWAIDRLGRSLIDLLKSIQHLEACAVDLYMDQQNIDTTTPMGKLLFQITGAFAEFERSMIRQRINAGLSVIKVKLARDGKFETKRGKVRTRLGRPGAKPEKIEAARKHLEAGAGIGKTARLTGLGTGTVHKLAREMRGTA